MISLFLAILCSASIALLFKHSESGHYNRMRVTTANYIAAFAFSFILFLGNPPETVHWGTVLGIGIPAGVCFFASFVLYQKSVKDNGASLSAMSGKMGILLPMIASIILWREIPTFLQIVGICLAIGAILYINFSPEPHHSIHRSLIWLFLVGGLGEFANKLFQMYGQLPDKTLFLFVVFATAFLLSLFYATKEAVKPGSSLKKDLSMGFAIGIPNLLSSFFLIQALTSVPAAVAFPAFSAGTVLIVTVLSRLIFSETINRRSAIGLALTSVALLLIF